MIIPHDKVYVSAHNFARKKYIILVMYCRNSYLNNDIYSILCYLLLAGGVSVVSGFTPVTYPARVSSECGQYCNNNNYYL